MSNPTRSHVLSVVVFGGEPDDPSGTTVLDVADLASVPVPVSAEDPFVCDDGAQEYCGDCRGCDNSAMLDCNASFRLEMLSVDADGKTSVEVFWPVEPMTYAAVEFALAQAPHRCMCGRPATACGHGW